MNDASLLKVLIDAGLGSRRQMAGAIRDGRITIDGQVVTGFNCPVDIFRSRICLDGVRVKCGAEPRVYLVLNKPAGVLTTTVDQRGRTTVMNFIPAGYRGCKLFPAGRLDKDTTGLVLLTNDGETAFRLTHPRFEHEKEYIARLDRPLDAGDAGRLERGVLLDDGLTYPAGVKAWGQGGDNRYSIVIHEGRKHIVRRMLAHLGYKVVSLKRVRLANITLGELNEGQVRELTRKEFEELSRQAGQENIAS